MVTYSSFLDLAIYQYFSDTGRVLFPSGDKMAETFIIGHVITPMYNADVSVNRSANLISIQT